VEAVEQLKFDFCHRVLILVSLFSFLPSEIKHPIQWRGCCQLLLVVSIRSAKKEQNTNTVSHSAARVSAVDRCNRIVTSVYAARGQICRTRVCGCAASRLLLLPPPQVFSAGEISVGYSTELLS
jgi:hypothetical protein